MNILLTSLLQAQTVPADSLKEPAAVLDQTIKTIIQTPVDQLVSTGLDYGMKFGLKILAAIAIYTIGAWLIKKVKKLIRKICERRNLEASLTSFLLSFSGISLSILLIVTTISVLGVDTTSFVALLAGSGVAIGMALSGTLQNFAGGVILLLLRPYRVGDYITSQGQSGTVKAIGLFSTQLSTGDNRTIFVPNSAISTSIIDNYSHATTRRIDWNITISYGDDVDVARQAILAMLADDNRVLNEPAEPMVALKELGDNAVVLLVRCWTANSDYWGLYFDINERIYKELPTKGINFPFPQLDVHIKQN